MLHLKGFFFPSKSKFVQSETKIAHSYQNEDHFCTESHQKITLLLILLEIGKKPAKSKKNMLFPNGK